ncbi:MAG: Na(+)/H(+) antiporter subunit B [Longimicrobiales bacterium]|jgi:multicomponent Na+:H+ antiporter subunit B|nr:Na(+)/H(+) antiporter subunit B [Longimicrobiales bacterium]
MSDQVILRVATKIIVPFVLLFALYVQFHGDFGPGGGFQAGVIFAAGIILYALVFGLRRTQTVVPSWVARVLAASGVLIYAGVGIASLFLGGEFLNYNVLAHNPQHGQHYGILLVEIGVMTTVLGVMITIFYFFAARGREDL